MEDVRKELKRGTLELVLLALLAEEDRYGYDIVATLDVRGGPAFRIKEGTLYPVLYRLEDRGDIEAYRDNPRRGVPRKYYRLTPDGGRRLAALRREWDEFVAVVNRFVHEDGSEPPRQPAPPPRGDETAPTAGEATPDNDHTSPDTGDGRTA